MGKLTKNGYDYYKDLDCWEPIEAALVVCGIDPCGVNYDNIPDEAKGVFAQSTIIDIYENPVIFPEKKIEGADKIRKYKKYCPRFCIDTGEISTIKLVCFEPRSYVSMLHDSFPAIDSSLETIHDPNHRPRLRWVTAPNFNENLPISEFVVNPSYVFEEEEDPDKIFQTYEDRPRYFWLKNSHFFGQSIISKVTVPLP